MRPIALFLTTDLALLELDGLPRSLNGIRKRALAEGWPFELRTVRGGTARAFTMLALPLVAQEDFVRRAASSHAVIEGRALGSPERHAYMRASKSRRLRATARVRALEMAERAFMIGWSRDVALSFASAETGLAPRTIRRLEQLHRASGATDPDAARLLPSVPGPTKGPR